MINLLITICGFMLALVSYLTAPGLFQLICLIVCSICVILNAVIYWRNNV